jgi:7-cyano-7-deazaguanine synthase
MHKVFCLLSGGADSSTTLAIARDEFPSDELEAVTFDYGQRHKREAECAELQAARFGASHHILDVKGLMTGMLVDKGEANEAIPEVSYAELPEGISPTYVSFRNGTMLSLLAARAQSWIMEQEATGGQTFKDNELIALEKGYKATLYCGVHADDGVNWAYPDCTPEFIGSMAAAIHVGTYFKVRLRAPLLFDTKVEVIRKGSSLGVDFANTWSCYRGLDFHCGVCPTCRSRREAFDLAGLADPTIYAENVDVHTGYLGPDEGGYVE